MEAVRDILEAEGVSYIGGRYSERCLGCLREGRIRCILRNFLESWDSFFSGAANLEQRVWAAAGYKPSSLCLKRVVQV